MKGKRIYLDGNRNNFLYYFNCGIEKRDRREEKNYRYDPRTRIDILFCVLFFSDRSFEGKRIEIRRIDRSAREETCVTRQKELDVVASLRLKLR